MRIIQAWLPKAAFFVVLLFSPVLVQAQDDTFLSYASEEGDYIGQGQQRTYTRNDAQITATADEALNHVTVSISGDTWWHLDLAAPQGQQLVPGVYEAATRWPFQEWTEPGLDFSGDGRGCNQLTGRFVVTEAVYGPNGYVERFQAAFEQHCEGMEPALYGEVKIVNPPPPPSLDMTLTISPKGSASRISGLATVGGTIACSTETTAYLHGILTQRANRSSLSTGEFYLEVRCSPTTSKWSANVSAFGVPFNPGQAELAVTANAYDPNYLTDVTRQANGVISLTRSK